MPTDYFRRYYSVIDTINYVSDKSSSLIKYDYRYNIIHSYTHTPINLNYIIVLFNYRSYVHCKSRLHVTHHIVRFRNITYIYL